MTHTPAQPQTPPPPPHEQGGGQASLAERLRGVVVDLRSELDVSRHVFRAGPAYVVRDPITFATHRFDPGDYAVLRAIQHDRPLGETFDHLVARGELEQADEEDFYAFILDLHQRSLLTLPINNGDALYQRYEKRKRAERLSKLLGVLFLRVPLVNPDRFLAATLPLFRWLYTTPALIVWLVVNAAAIAVAVTRFDELTAPVLTTIEGDHILMLWGALIGLKVIHEFGHAYACKSFGGHVPEMGAFFILFTPLAYVDATDSWTFPKTRQRAIVTLGGVYFESIVGVIALAVWSVTETGTLHTLAYQIIILATITTIAFNMNPLLRYDAYYLVSDLVAIPNLRARCQEAVAGVCKRVLFGIRFDRDGEPFTFRPGLTAFGLAQIAYRVFILVTIATVVTMKFGSLGVAIAVLVVGMTLFKALRALARYVLTAEETAPVRFRAVTTTFGLAAVLTAAVGAVPLPWPVHARGVVSFETVEPVRAPGRGVIAELPAGVGDLLEKGDTLALLVNPDAESELLGLRADRHATGARIVRAAMESPAEALHAELERDRLDARIRRLAAERDAMRLAAPADGRVLDLIEPDPGAAVEWGDPVLLYASGAPEAVFHVRAFEFDSLRLAPGDTLVCRSPAFPDREIAGVVTHLGPVGSRDIEQRIRHAAPQGLVPLDQRTGHAAEPYFEIRVRLPHHDAALAGINVRAPMPTRHRTTAAVIERRVTRFLNRVREGSDG